MAPPLRPVTAVAPVLAAIARGDSRRGSKGRHREERGQEEAQQCSYRGIYTFGSLYNGDFKSFRLTLNYRVGAKFTTGIEWSHQDVDLPTGSFINDLAPFRVSYAFTPLYSIQALIQYNSQTGTVSSNIRLALLDRTGIDRYDADTGVLFPAVLGRSLIIKYTRLLDF